MTAAPADGHFNSIKVRLKRVHSVASGISLSYFNSIKVRLKRVCSPKGTRSRAISIP